MKVFTDFPVSNGLILYGCSGLSTRPRAAAAKDRQNKPRTLWLGAGEPV